MKNARALVDRSKAYPQRKCVCKSTVLRQNNLMGNGVDCSPIYQLKERTEMPTIKVQVSGKVAKNLTPEVEIVCNNEDYEIEYDFDEAWSGALAKTGLFICNGELIPVPFDGNVCPVPIIENAKLLAVGVSTSDGKLATTTPAYVNCLLSASDLAKNKIPPPSKSVYDEIIALLNKYLQQSGGEGAKEIVTVDITAMLTNQDTALFIDLSERYIKGEIALVASLDGSAAVVSGVQDTTDFIIWTAFMAYPSNWGFTTITIFNLIYDRSNEVIQLSTSDINNYELPDLSLAGNMNMLIGMKYFPESNTSEYVAVDLKNELKDNSWTDEEKAEVCDSIGAMSKNGASVDGSMSLKANEIILTEHSGDNSIELYEDGLCLYGDVTVNDEEIATKKEIGDIETALNRIIAIQNTLIGGGTQ